MDSNKVSMAKDEYINQIALKSGVTKKNIRKVLDAISEVVYEGVAEERKVPICDGIIITGSVKDEEQKKYYDCNANQTKLSRYSIRLKCIFTRKGKKFAHDSYLNKTKRKGIEEND